MAVYWFLVNSTSYILYYNIILVLSIKKESNIRYKNFGLDSSLLFNITNLNNFLLVTGNELVDEHKQDRF